MCARFRILLTKVNANANTMVKIIQASVCLHNYLKQTDTARYCRTGFSDSYDKSGNLLPGSWRDEV